MRVLIYAHAFAPSVGGAETLVMMLAQGLAESMGQSEKEKDGQGGSGSVTVMTPTPSDGFEDKSLPFRVVRRPGLRQLVRSIREADIVHLAGPCFVPMLLGLILRKPTVVEHHGFQSICPNGRASVRGSQARADGCREVAGRRAGSDLE